MRKLPVILKFRWGPGMVSLSSHCVGHSRHRRSSCCVSVGTNLTGIHEDAGLIPGPAQWVKDMVFLWAVVYVGHKCNLDLALLWLWYRAGSCSSDSNPSLGTSICQRCSPKKQKKKKKAGTGQHRWKKRGLRPLCLSGRSIKRFCSHRHLYCATRTI